MSDHRLTKASYDALCARRQLLETEALVDAQARLAAIQEAGDPEGLESTSAVFDVQQIQSQIDQLDRTIAACVVVDQTRHDVVEVGATVTIDLGDGPERYLVDLHGDSTCLSPESPIGRSIAGRRAGEEVSVTTPAGVLTVRIVSVD